MRIKLDENLPDRLVEALAHLGHDVDTVEHERLGGANDLTVWNAAQESGRFLVTQDPGGGRLHGPTLSANLREPLATLARFGWQPNER